MNNEYIVWVGGVEYNFATKEQAETFAAEMRDDGYDDVIVESIQGAEARKRELIEAHRDDRAALQALTNWIVGGNG